MRVPHRRSQSSRVPGSIITGSKLYAEFIFLVHIVSLFVRARNILVIRKHCLTQEKLEFVCGFGTLRSTLFTVTRVLAFGADSLNLIEFSCEVVV